MRVDISEPVLGLMPKQSRPIHEMLQFASFSKTQVTTFSSWTRCKEAAELPSEHGDSTTNMMDPDSNPQPPIKIEVIICETKVPFEDR